MARIAVIGAGITGITSAYALVRSGHDVTVLDCNRYPAMETSFANGGQLSASNAEVWNHWGTISRGIRWLLDAGAPLSLNPSPSWHKYSWLAEFVGQIRNYRRNTVETTRLAIAAREHLFRIAEAEQIEFDLERRGILHIYHDDGTFAKAREANGLLREAGLDRYEVDQDEMKEIEPALTGSFVGGFYTPSDSSGDIHKFTRGLSRACDRLGVAFVYGATVEAVRPLPEGVVIDLSEPEWRRLGFDAVVICAGVGSRKLAASAGDRINIYPVKGYSITVELPDAANREATPRVSLLDDAAKIVSSRLGDDRFRVAGTAEFNGFNKDIRQDRIAPLIGWIRREFPAIDTDRVTPWAGLRPMTPSMMPFVGRGKRPNIYYNTGHGHLGWTLSAATAEIVRARLDQDLGMGIASGGRCAAASGG